MNRKTVEAHIVGAFIDGEEGGNLAGVVLDADALDGVQKLAVAAKVGLSETAFVSTSKVAGFKLEFFTPTRQIAHCGHATIATFSLLRQLGKVSEGKTSKETIDGNRDIVIEGDRAFMEQRAPRYTELPRGSEDLKRALSSLGLSEEGLAKGLSPWIVNTGNSFLVIPLRDEAAVAALAPNLDAISKISEQFDLIGYYAFSPDVKVAGRDAGARMFAPRYGIPEESGTGMAAGPLACVLHDKMAIEKATLSIEQGHLMPARSPCVITVRLELKEGKIQRLMAGGKGKAVRSVSVLL